MTTTNFTANAKKVTFSDAKAGDKVWSITHGWGVVTARLEPHHSYPLTVEFEDRGRITYTLWGLRHFSDHNPTLFWDEVKFEIPEKPLPQLEVDAKVLVWVSPEHKHRRHFSHFTKGQLYAFDSGATSFSMLHRNSITCWPYWELAE